MNYLIHVLTVLLIYAILAQSVNLLLGQGGLLSVGQAAFQGIGAYAAVLLVMKAGWAYPAAVVIALALSGLLGALVALPTLRFRGDYFVLGTMAFQVILTTVLNNVVSVTNGPHGIAGIPRPNLAGWETRSPGAFLALVAMAAAIVTLLAWQLMRSPFGRTLRTIRDDKLAAVSLGKNVRTFRISVFVYAGMMAALAGVLQAGHITYIDPTNFALEDSMLAVAMVVIGGTGSLHGPVVGAAFAILLPELLRFVHVPEAAAANLRQILFGLILILAMRFRPQGLVGNYAFD